VRFNSEPKRYKSVSLSAKRSVFTLVGLAHGVVTEKLRLPYEDLSPVKLKGLTRESGGKEAKKSKEDGLS
jgi:hypothetical protein